MHGFQFHSTVFGCEADSQGGVLQQEEALGSLLRGILHQHLRLSTQVIKF